MHFQVQSNWALCAVVASLAGMFGCAASPDANPSAGSGGTGGSGTTAPQSCGNSAPPAVLIRRMTNFEFSNTVRDLLGDTSRPGNALPGEQVGNGFGNDSTAQAVTFGHADRYSSIAETLATNATTPEKIGGLAACAPGITSTTDAVTEATCARTAIESFLPKVFRRPLEAGEADGLLALFSAVRATGSSFASSVAAVLEAALQGPDFLYRPELGVAQPGAVRLRLTGHEMASRLSFLLWGSTPDDGLRAAAASGALETTEGVRAEAARLLADLKARDVVRHFFDSLLPIPSLSNLARDPGRYPGFSPEIGELMRQETQTFLDHQIFSGAAGTGTWPSVFTANYTFVNEKLAAFYGIPGIVGDQMQQVPLDPSKRAGLLGQAGIVAGPVHSNEANPVVRGSFIVQKLLCKPIPLPSGDILAQVVPPPPELGGTVRQRYTQHSSDTACSSCHQFMDPVGFALENYDPVGLWRDSENGLPIDATGQTSLLGAAFNGPVELGQRLAEAEVAQECFATHWANFAYGKIMTDADACTTQSLNATFKESGYKVQDLVLALTQSDAFLYLPAVRP